MSLYARNDPNVPGFIDVRDFASPPSAGKGWFPLVIDVQPTPSASQVVISAGIVFEQTQARQTWALRAKNQAETDADDDAAELPQARAAITTLKQEIAGTSNLTAGQFRVFAARVLLFLLRRAIGGSA